MFDYYVVCIEKKYGVFTNHVVCIISKTGRLRQLFFREIPRRGASSSAAVIFGGRNRVSCRRNDKSYGKFTYLCPQNSQKRIYDESKWRGIFGTDPHSDKKSYHYQFLMLACQFGVAATGRGPGGLDGAAFPVGFRLLSVPAGDLHVHARQFFAYLF